MKFRATKDHYERETDEANRLVRPAPKVKPPRRDRRRETVEPDKDPDLESKDKDLSMNYKDIGGSVGAVLSRWQRLADSETPKIRVRNKDTGQVRDVTKEFLQTEEGGAYEPVEKELEREKTPQEPQAPKSETPKSQEKKPKTKPSKDDEERQLQSYRDLQNAMEDDLDLQAFSKSIFDEKKPGGIGQLPNDFQLDKLKGLQDKFPVLKKYKTVGDVRKALNNTKHLKKLEQRFQDKWKTEGAKQKEEAAPQGPEKKEEGPQKEEAPGGGPSLDPEKQKALTESGRQIREFAKDDPVFATVLHQLDDANPASLLKLREKIDPNEDVTTLFHGARNRLPENIKTVGDLVNALKSSEPAKEEAPKAPAKEEKPTAPAEAPAKGEEGADPTVQKLLKVFESLGIKPREREEEEGLGSEEKSQISDFVKGDKYKDPAFKSWADSDSRTVEDDDGNMLFPSEEKGEHVPFEKLAPEEQLSWIRRFKKGQKLNTNVDALRAQALNDKHLARVLQDLANPHSDLMQDIEERGEAGKLESLKKSVPELRDLEFPKGVKSLGDLMDAARAMHPALPPAPARRHATPREQDQAQQRLIENFPVDVAEKLLGLHPPLHPDDVGDLVEHYTAAKMGGNDEELFKAVEGNYETDPTKVRPPATGVNRFGETVPFDHLRPNEQADALQKHRMLVLAMSLAAREKQIEKLKKKTDAPSELLGAVADFTLQKHPGESDEEREERAKGAAKKLFGDAVKRGLLESDTDRYARWQADRNKLMEQHEQEARDRGEEYDPAADDELPNKPAPKEITERQLDKLFQKLGDDSAAKYIVAGYAQAGDYLRARQEFLDSDSPEAISEQEPPEKIARGLRKMGEFFNEAAKKYPEDMRDLVPAKEDLRDKILGKIRTLSPEKYPFVKAHVQEQIFDDYEDKLKKWHKQYEKAVKRQEKIKHSPYRGEEPKADIPEPPPRPDGYLQSRGSDKDKKNKRKELFDQFRKSVGTPDDELAKAEKTASLLWRVASRSRKYSTCNDYWAMGAPLSVRVAERVKNSVYWGVEPYPSGKEGFAPYTPWTQMHQRDLSEKDFDSILKAARDWLKQPVLATSVEGIYRDTQLRAALDLALRSHENGKYSVGLQPPLYNMLLARLGGAPQNETLLTDRSNIRGPITGSLYDSTGEGQTMKASALIRQAAVRYAATNAAVAYELLDLATKVAEEEQEQAPAQQEQKQGGQVPPQFLEHMKKKEDKKEDQGQEQQKQASYTQLRAAVIKQAHENPELRAAYLPLLSLIKQIG